MESLHPLKGLLQLQLASDASAVLHLPYILQTLSAEHFIPSQHSKLWCTRVNALVHSRDTAARWSGLCLALQTSVHSRSLMMEYATSWIGVALPLLSRDEPAPTLKAAIRLLRQIFSSAMGVAEFQRQVCLPNVPKCSAALISLAGKHSDQDVKLLTLDTLTHIVPLFPTLHRSLHQSLSSTALRFLKGSSPRPMPAPLVDAASRLYSVLHVTGGKVGAANVWRKALDGTLDFAWNAFSCLRRTSDPAARGKTALSLSGDDPMISVPLNLDRLRVAVRMLCDLLCAPASRPVAVPVGTLVQFCLAMLRCTPEEKVAEEVHVDASTRAMELASIPCVWSLSCEFLECLAESAHRHLLPYLPQLVSHLAYHLEQQRTSTERLSFLRASRALLTTCPRLHDSITASRLARAIAPSLCVLLSIKSQGQQDVGVAASNAKSRKSKKRAREYEGDELFNVTADVIFTSKADGDALLASIDAVRLILRNSQLPPAVRSLLSRVLLAVYISLPQIQPAFVSSDLSLHGMLYEKVRRVCLEQASGTSNVLSKSLGLVISRMACEQDDMQAVDVLREVDLLLHPRVPPLVRSLPHVEMLSLFREEEGEEELSMRRALGLATLDETLRQDHAVPPEPVRGSEATVNLSLPTLGRTEPVRSSGVPTPIRQPPQISSRATNAAQSVASCSETAPEILVPVASTAYCAPHQLGVDTLRAQGPPVPSHPTPSTRTTPTPAPFTSAIQLPTAGPLNVAVPEARLQAQAPVPMDEDDEDEPMPTINMDSDSDGGN